MQVTHEDKVHVGNYREDQDKRNVKVYFQWFRGTLAQEVRQRHVSDSKQ